MRMPEPLLRSLHRPEDLRPTSPVPLRTERHWAGPAVTNFMLVATVFHTCPAKSRHLRSRPDQAQERRAADTA